MKTTFTTTEISHVWAHKGAPHGKAQSAMSFDGPLLFSYGTGIARHIEHKGKPAIVINDGSFSVSTSKHQGLMRRAIPDSIPCFYISEGRGARLHFSGSQLFDHAIEKAGEAAKVAKETSKGTMKEQSALASQEKWLSRAKEVSAFFGLRRKVDEKTIARLAKVKAKAERDGIKARAKRDEENRIKAMADFEAWKSGADVWFPSHSFPTVFRVENDELVSSQGARVPLDDAKRAYRFATSKRAEAWRANGVTCPVGKYALDSISEAGIVAGCHRISWQEMERLAPVLSVGSEVTK